MQRVTFTSARGETVVLYQRPFFLNKIEGLGDVSANIQTQRSPNQDGSISVATTLEERAIPIEVVILENLLYNRQVLSRVFNPKLGPGTLTYENDNYTRSIKAQSEHVPSFPDDRPRRTQRVFIDLICHDPYFDGGGEVKNEIAFWVPMFEFELEIPLETDGIEMGYRSPTQIVSVYNEGHTDTGIKIEFKANTTVVNPRLTNVETGKYIKVQRTMEAGDVITVTTANREKKITLNRNGVVTNIFNDLVFGSTFLQLEVGDNLFQYGADDNEEFLEVSIYHRNRFVGV